MLSPSLLTSLESINVEGLAVFTGLIVLILKQYFTHGKSIEEIKAELAIIKEKVSRVERDIDTLESTYMQTTTELRYHLRYQDGRILKTT